MNIIGSPAMSVPLLAVTAIWLAVQTMKIIGSPAMSAPSLAVTAIRLAV
jgi:hypothetical protein